MSSNNADATRAVEQELNGDTKGAARSTQAAINAAREASTKGGK